MFYSIALVNAKKALPNKKTAGGVSVVWMLPGLNSGKVKTCY